MFLWSLNLAGKILVAACLGWTAASSLYYFPHSLSYFNEIAGGPENGAAHLVDSNLDWGQDLFFLKKWYDEHPEARPFYLAYFGHFDPTCVGIDFEFPGKDAWLRLPGFYAASRTLAKGCEYPVPNGKGRLLLVKNGDLGTEELDKLIGCYSIVGKRKIQ